MVSLELAFAVGAVAFAGVIGGILFAIYPTGFGGYDAPENTGTTPSDTYGGTPVESSNSTAAQNQTTSGSGPSSPTPGSGGY